MNNVKSHRILPAVLISAAMTGAIMLVSYILNGNMGFGSNSLTVMDGEVQYVDFFCYLKDVLSGNDSVLYTLNKGLGGTGIALFAYYLASPLNLISVLIPKESMPVITDILLLLKTILASAFAALALSKRFPSLKRLYTVIFAVGYSLMHWNLVQSSNIMWLDGAYMLPLIMLSVYTLVKRGNIVFLSISCGLSILFNWYTGGFNCFFAIIWFITELLIERFSDRDGSAPSLSVRSLIIRFICSMILAVALSAVLFLPNSLALTQGKGSSFDPGGFIGGILGNPLNIIQNNAAGVYNFNGSGHPSFFAGSLCAAAVLTLFRSSYFSLREKLLAAGVVLLGLLSVYLQPFYFIFCLFKSVESYEYRHAYVFIMMLVFIAAWYFSRYDGEPKESGKLFQDAVFIAAAILVLTLVFPNDDRDMAGTAATIIVLVLAGLCLWLLSSARSGGRAFQTVFTVILACACIGELFVHVYTINRCYNNDNEITAVYKDYAGEMEAFSKEYADRTLRISETFHRDSDADQLSACLNCGLAFNMMTNTTYSSCTESIQTDLLDRLGYKDWAGVMNVVNTSVIPADSFLGVKYVISKTPIPGLEAVSALSSGRIISENPYALPLCFTVQGSVSADAGTGDNVFDNLNSIYSAVSGTEEVFVPAGGSFVRSDGRVTISIEKSADPVYCSVKNGSAKARILINGEHYISCGEWLSSGVFLIPDTDTGPVELTVIAGEELSASDIDIRRADTSALYAAKEQILKNNTAQESSIINGSVSVKTSSDDESCLIVTIPAVRGWSAIVNGRAVPVEHFSDSLIMLKLDPGENDILLKYTVPGLKSGAALSAAAAVCLIVLGILVTKRRKNDIL